MINVKSDRDPTATALWRLTDRLAAITGGRSKEGPQALVNEGLRILRGAPPPPDRECWAIFTVAQTEFLEAASAHRPSLLPSATECRTALVRNNVTMRRRR
jgi:hypothetical protein